MPKKVDHGKSMDEPPASDELSLQHSMSEVSHELDSSCRAMAEVEELVNVATMATRIGDVESRLSELERRAKVAPSVLPMKGGEDPAVSARFQALEAAVGELPPPAAFAKMMKRLAECTLHLEEQVNELAAASVKTSDNLEAIRAESAKTAFELQTSIRLVREQTEGDVQQLREDVYKHCVAVNEKVEKKLHAAKDSWQEECSKVATTSADLQRQVMELRLQLQIHFLDPRQEQRQGHSHQEQQTHEVSGLSTAGDSEHERGMSLSASQDMSLSASQASVSVRSNPGSALLTRSHEFQGHGVTSNVSSHQDAEPPEDRLEIVHHASILASPSVNTRSNAQITESATAHDQTPPPRRNSAAQSISNSTPLVSPQPVVRRLTQPASCVRGQSLQEHGSPRVAGDSTKSRAVALSPTSSGRFPLSVKSPLSHTRAEGMTTVAEVVKSATNMSLPAACSDSLAATAPGGMFTANPAPFSPASTQRTSPLIVGRPLLSQDATSLSHGKDIHPVASALVTARSPTACTPPVLVTPPRTLSPTQVVRARSPPHANRAFSPQHAQHALSPPHEQQANSPQQAHRTLSPPLEQRAFSPQQTQRAVSPQQVHRATSPQQAQRALSPQQALRAFSPQLIPRVLSPKQSCRALSLQQAPRAVSPGLHQLTLASSPRAQQSVGVVHYSPPSSSMHGRSGSPGGRGRSPATRADGSARTPSPVGSLDLDGGSLGNSAMEGEVWQKVDDVLRNIGERKVRKERHERLATKMESGLRRLIEKLDQSRTGSETCITDCGPVPVASGGEGNINNAGASNIVNKFHGTIAGEAARTQQDAVEHLSPGLISRQPLVHSTTTGFGDFTRPPVHAAFNDIPGSPLLRDSFQPGAGLMPSFKEAAAAASAAASAAAVADSLHALRTVPAPQGI